MHMHVPLFLLRVDRRTAETRQNVFIPSECIRLRIGAFMRATFPHCHVPNHRCSIAILVFGYVGEIFNETAAKEAVGRN